VEVDERGDGAGRRTMSCCSVAMNWSVSAGRTDSSTSL
jgi:hypothetical protein